MSKAIWILVCAGGTSLSAQALEAFEPVADGELSPLLGEPYVVPSAPWISVREPDSLPRTPFLSAISPTEVPGDATEASTLLAGARLDTGHEQRSAGSLLAQLVAGLVTVGFVARRRLTLR